MRDSDFVWFLQWALPQMGLRWAGFRRVRRQVCRRIAARMQQLGVPDPHAYAAYLERNPTEWTTLEALCGVTISRFYRDRGVFDCLAEQILPELARSARAGGTIDVWSAGCASGEEPYSLALMWEMQLAPSFPETTLRVLATDRDAQAHRACEPSLLSAQFAARAAARLDRARLRARRRGVVLEPRAPAGSHLRAPGHSTDAPTGPFSAHPVSEPGVHVLRRSAQRRMLQDMIARLKPDGYLVIGAHEQLPDDRPDLRRVAESRCIYRVV